ncbi:MAG: epoxyqueuosine reductase QueH [Odoribacteraceae bacterium]|nr:epoxyqueuosine reductase QueH [Odoribacteraceae bacterium]
MGTLLLHACCAPCSAAVIEWLVDRDVRPVLFYFNPNIFPREEYDRRAMECTRHATTLGLEIITGEYDHAAWLAAVTGLEREPERGARCARCFEIRTRATALLARERGIGLFATTLASSRWKDLAQISAAGQRAVTDLPDVTFLDRNWRKGGLDERRRALLARYDFYNQSYCGCEFSATNRVSPPDRG